MSGKHSIKKKKKTPQKDNRVKIILSIMVFAVLFVTVIALLVQSPEELPDETQGPGSSATEETDTEAHTEAPTSELEQELQTESVSDTSLSLDHGMKVTKIGRYTGLYMEDGSDEIVSGVLTITVENTGEEYIQYAEITLTSESGMARFVLTTLFPGQSVVLLETSRLAYDSDVEYITAKAGSVAVFSEIPSLCESRLKVQGLDGVLNVTNISGQDITGDIVIYYKNAIDEVLYGGITYRVRITGGMKSGEIKQIVSDHFSASGSMIMFITCGE